MTKQSQRLTGSGVSISTQAKTQTIDDRGNGRWGTRRRSPNTKETGSFRDRWGTKWGNSFRRDFEGTERLLAAPAGSHSPDDYDARAIGGFNHCKAILSGHSHSLLAQFGLTPKSKRRLGAGDPVDALWNWSRLKGGQVTSSILISILP